MDERHFIESTGNRSASMLNDLDRTIGDIGNMSSTMFGPFPEGNGTMPNIPIGPFPGGIPPLEENTLAHSIIHQIVVPVVAVLGILGNGPSLVILCRSKSSQSFLKYLTALTTIDLLLLLAALLRSVAEIIHRNIKPISFVKALSDLYIGIVAGSCLQRLSATFITVISLERFLAVVYPWYYRRSFLRRKPTSTTVAMVTIHLLVAVPALITNRVGPSPIPGTDGYRIIPTWNRGTTEIARDFYVILNIVLGNVVPLIIVLFSTVAIVIWLNRSRFDSKFRIEKNNFDAVERERMTFVLLSIAIVFIICMSIAAIMFITPVVKPFSLHDVGLVQTMMDIADLLICINSACNFALYLLASKSFRDMFVNQLKACCTQTDRASSPSTGENHNASTQHRPDFIDVRVPPVSLSRASGHI